MPADEPADGSDDGADTAADEQRELWYVRDAVVVVGGVIIVCALLVLISGVWPPFVAIESGSMEPNMEKGDMVYVMAEGRFAGPDARDGVVTASAGAESDYERFGRPGDVIVFEPDGSEARTPIIHRAMFYVEDGENWYDRADPDAVGAAEDCATLANCPAPHDGFVTKGDANGNYDQVGSNEIGVVRPRWVIGTAEVRIPNVGWVRL